MNSNLIVELKEGVQFCLKEEFCFYFEGLLDERAIEILSPLSCFSVENGGVLKIPSGFYTDFGSIPLIFQSLISPVGKPSKAYVVHDYLIMLSKGGNLRRKDADLIFLYALKRQGIGIVKRSILYGAVRVYSLLLGLFR
ncbi:DUF1353 domain-containing protein [Helicobacter sp. WB40]|uniref:DUF1353 domain-containing protein n=1 Tax=Helicobacter sp. WB40 TaxID=3004130 RepID=UPI0022EBC736|nr:DUF1353 domain-containing protein [Helicobacter sp. WB40]MDA3967366.1 DUF1353 domain-containing protein [Helicobacter sp. WB40]